MRSNDLKSRRTLLVFAPILLLVSCSPSVHDLAARGDLDSLKVVIEKKPEGIEERNELGKTPLHYAVNFAQQDVMIYLVEAGADLDARDTTGLTPLHVSAIIDLPGAARLLIRSGASLETQDDFGDTPLHTAALHGSTRVFDLLIDRGADINTRNQEGLRPIDLARRHENKNVVSSLERAKGKPE